MPQPEVRVAGSTFTTLSFDGQPIAWLQGFTDSGQQAMAGAGPTPQTHEVVWELGLNRPRAFVSSYLLGPGRITCQMKELWNQRVWEQFRGFANTHNIVDILEVIRRRRDNITCEMIIRPPGGQPRGKVFHGCLITSAPDGEQVQIGTLSVNRDITVEYLYSTPLRGNPSPNR